METEQISQWITQKEAAELSGKSLKAIHQLANRGRLRVKAIFGKRLVNRQDILEYKPMKVGRPKKGIKSL